MLARVAAGDQLVQRGAQRVNVRLRLGAPGDLLRRGVAGRAPGRAIGLGAALAVAAHRLGAGDAEVHQRDLAGVIDNNVRRLDVAVDDRRVLAVQVDQQLGHLHRR